MLIQTPSANRNPSVRINDSQDQHEREQRSEQQRGDLHRWRHSCHRLPDSRIIERHQDHQHQERVTRPIGRVPHGPEPTEEEHRSAEHVPGKFNEDLSRDPSRPTVHLARSFPDLINVPVRDERNLQLLSTGNGQDQDDEDREQLVLNALQGAWALPEGETDEKTTADVQYELGRDVGGIAPDGSGGTSRNGDGLVKPRGRVFGMEIRFDGGPVSSIVVDPLDLLCSCGSLERPLPNGIPVNSRRSSSTSSDHVKHELSPVISISMR